MKYDCIVIGCGPGGYKAAERLADFKKSVCIVEQHPNMVGGVCLNEGCVPVKSLLESAKIYSQAINAGEFGIDCNVAVINMEKIHQTVKENIATIKSGLLWTLKKKSIDFVFGSASFASPEEIEVIQEDGNKKYINADYFILSPGSAAKSIPDIETDGKYIMNSSQVLRSRELPKNILIVGGGYIGCEFASLFNKFGVKVTIIEICPQILPGEDSDVTKTLVQEFKKLGIEVILEISIKSALRNKSGVKVILESVRDGSLKECYFDRVLVAAGRVPNIQRLNLANAGVSTRDGFIEVDSRMRTNVSNIFAVGDVINTPPLAYTAYREGIIAAETISGINETTAIDYNLAPRVVFSTPPVAFLGSADITKQNPSNAITKQNPSNAEKVKVKIKKKFFKANAKAIIQKETSGFVKIIYNENSRQILAASIIGPAACELIHILSIAMYSGLSFDEIGKVIFAHPTLSEIIGDI